MDVLLGNNTIVFVILRSLFFYIYYIDFNLNCVSESFSKGEIDSFADGENFSFTFATIEKGIPGFYFYFF